MRPEEPEKKSKYTDAELHYLGALRKMSGERRVEIASELFEMAKAVARAGIINQNPGISEEELQKALIKRIYG